MQLKATEAINDYSLGSEAAFKEAKRKGQIVVLPKDNELFIDIDDLESMQTFEERIDRIEAFIFVESVVKHKSRSNDPDKFHITVTLRHDINAIERILLQLLLGSDSTREMLSYFRVKDDDPHPTLFIENKPEENSDQPTFI